MAKFKHITVPDNGDKIEVEGENLIVGNHPIIPFIEGDGIGADIWSAARLVLDTAIKAAYSGERRIEWMEVYAGNKAEKVYANKRRLPGETVKAIKEYTVAIKGPLASRLDSPTRNLNYQLRHSLDLFTNVRPVKYSRGIPGITKNSNALDAVIISENLEDLCDGIEFKAGTKSAGEFVDFLNSKNKTSLGYDTSIGLKRISEFGTMRLIKRAVEFALENKRESVTIVHSSNVMKQTEGCFREWGYKSAKKFFPDRTITEKELIGKYKGKKPTNVILIKDRLAEMVLQDLLLNPGEHDVIAAPSMTGNLLSIASAAHVGGVGTVPSANLSYSIGVFEPVHGTVQKYAEKDVANPTGMIQAGVMMLEYLGWSKAANIVKKSLDRTIKSKIVTKDFARFIKGARSVKCSRFAREIVRNMK